MRLALLIPILSLCGCMSLRQLVPQLAYRDLQVYAVGDSITIVNRSARALTLSAHVDRFRWQGRIEAGEKAEWKLGLKPAEFAGAVLRGAIETDRVERLLTLGVEADIGITGCFAPRPPPRLPIEPQRTVALAGFRIFDMMPASATPGTRTELSDAVRDLQRIVKRLGDIDLPLVADSAGPRIQILQRDSDALSAAGSYHLRIQPDEIRIEAASLEGARNGIYGLLTDHLGCHWFQPRGLGESLPPPSDPLLLPEVDEWHSPSWFSVPGMSWRGCGEWDRRNRSVINDGRMKFGHAWHRFINYKSHPPDRSPEFYARDESGAILDYEKGWTHTNFCSSNPQVLDIVAGVVNDGFDANPQRIVASLDPNDYAPMCRCSDCLALDRSLGVDNPDGSEAADRLLHFSAEIHRRLKPEHQDKFLGILIYGHQMQLPKIVAPHAQHAGVICNFPPRYDHSRPWIDPSSPPNRDFLALVRGWGERLSQLGYYDYYGHYYYFGPFPMIHKMREDLPSFHAMGGTFLDIEAQPNFGIQGLNHYIAAQLAWNVDADVDARLACFMRHYYGPAATEMNDFWMTAERYFSLAAPGVRTDLRVAARPDFWDDLEDRLARAERAAHSASSQIQDRIAFHRAGFDYGRRRYTLQHKYGHKLQRATTPEAKTECLEYADWVRELRKRCPDGGDTYWPPLVRDYFYLDVPALLAGQ
ncbi:MAG: hypothetical protein ACI8W8_000936 [Rhodothermales bacterium]|jgi:hypothetical protein